MSGRNINDNMSFYESLNFSKKIKNLTKSKKNKILIMGATFKENCKDMRNSKVIDLIKELKDFGCNVEVSDYWADEDEVRKTYNLELTSNLNYQDYNAIVLAVAHDKYRKIKLNNDSQVVFDVKSILEFYDGRL